MEQNNLSVLMRMNLKVQIYLSVHKKYRVMNVFGSSSDRSCNFRVYCSISLKPFKYAKLFHPFYNMTVLVLENFKELY